MADWYKHHGKKSSQFVHETFTFGNFGNGESIKAIEYFDRCILPAHVPKLF